MERGEFYAINFPEFELIYKITDQGLSRIEWASGEDKYILTKDKHDNIAGMTSNDKDRIYFASEKNLTAIDVQSGKELWSVKHDMSLHKDRKVQLDYMKKSDDIERILITAYDSMGIFDATDGKQLVNSPSKYW